MLSNLINDSVTEEIILNYPDYIEKISKYISPKIKDKYSYIFNNELF